MRFDGVNHKTVIWFGFRDVPEEEWLLQHAVVAESFRIPIGPGYMSMMLAKAGGPVLPQKPEIWKRLFDKLVKKGYFEWTGTYNFLGRRMKIGFPTALGRVHALSYRTEMIMRREGVLG